MQDEPQVIAVKAVGDWELDVLGVPFGGPNGGKDSDGEYFDERTNLHADKFSLPPVVYYHGFTPEGRPAGDPEFIGKTVSREQRPDGVWFRVVLDRANAFAQRVWESAKQGAARASSGAIAHLVRTDTDGHIRHWPLTELSLLDADGPRQPANAYAVALPVMKAVYKAAGLPLPIDDISDPEAGGIGDRVTVAPTAERSQPQPNGVREMDATEIKAVVAQALAEAERERAAKAEAEKAESEKLAAATKAAVEDARKVWEAEAAKSGRLPTVDGAPAVLTFDRKYDNLDAADHSLLYSILQRDKDAALKGEARENSLKALAAKSVADASKDEAAHEGLKAMRTAGIKSDELHQSTLASHGDEWVGVMYATQLWQNIRAATPVVSKMPSVEVPPGTESITIPLESTDPTFYKVAQAASLPTTEATGWPNATITSSQLSTTNQSLTVAKMGARALWTGEMEEDSLIPWVSQLRGQLERAAAEQMEYVIIDGDTATTASTNINDIAGTPASTDLFLLVNGFRKLAIMTNSANSRSGGTLSENDFLETLKLMGVAGKNAAQMSSVDFIIDPWVHYKALEVATLKTRDVFGQPTIENGNLTRIWGHNIHVSHFMCYAGVVLGTVTTDAYKLKSQTADGKVDQDTQADNVAGSLLAVRWDQWLMGWKRRMQIETTRIARADATEIVATMRWGLIYRDTEASAVTYGISV